MGTLWFFRYFEYFVITPDAQGCKSGISWIIVRDHLFVENKQKNIIWTLVQGISGWLLDYKATMTLKQIEQLQYHQFNY